MVSSSWQHYPETDEQKATNYFHMSWRQQLRPSASPNDCPKSNTQQVYNMVDYCLAGAAALGLWSGDAGVSY